jgi:alpha-galactosidase
MAKITLVGAGSTVFAQNILGDVLSNPELADSDIALFDIDAERLATSQIMTRRIAGTLGLTQLRVAATTDRATALKGADFVILMMQIGGYKPATVIDFEIPKTFGVRQTIADTLGIGGIFRALRTIPVVFDIARDMQTHCPGALMMNYVNPMAMITWAMQERFPDIPFVGLCHSVQETSGHLARILGEDINQIDYRAAGINHVSFFTQFEKRLADGSREDLYAKLRTIAASDSYPDGDKVRFAVLKHFGHFVTESSEHFSEYTPWFIKSNRPDLVDRHQVPLDEYITRCEDQITEWETLKVELEDESRPMEVEKSNEYAAAIIHGMVTGTNHKIYGNVRNNGLIENLPANAAVEVPCHVDRGGIQPIRVGEVPAQLAAIMRWQINVQELTVEAALTNRREHVYHAAMMDPHTAAELSLDDIRALCDAMIDAHGTYLPTYH